MQWLRHLLEDLSCHNIEMVNERPAWLHRCEQCFACLQWCPQEAIQYGKKTVKYPRYHHPEVTLKDMLEQASANSLISTTSQERVKT